MLAQHVDESEADGIAEGLGDLGDAFGLNPLDVRVDDRFATEAAGRALAFWNELEIDMKRSISASYIEYFQCIAELAMIRRQSLTAATSARSLTARIAVITDIHGNHPALESVPHCHRGSRRR